MQNNYMLRMPTHVYGGTGSLEKLKDILAFYAPRKVALFVDAGVKAAGLLPYPQEMVEAVALCTVIVDAPPEPKVDAAEEITARFAREGFDLIVAIGGGSVMDMAKLACVAAPEEYTIRDLVANPGRAQKRMPIVMVPTTAGTGAEATPNAIVTIPEQELKVGIVNPALIADVVILDPVMTEKLPRPIAAATGMDALAHAIESYTSNKATPMSDMFAMQAMRLIFANLEVACNAANNLAARESMLLASFYSGVAIAAAGTTAVHALAYPLGGKYGIPHGVANAMLLAPVMALNEESCRQRLCDIYDAVGDAQLNRDVEKSGWVIVRLKEIVKNLEIPGCLKAFGIGRENLESLTDSAFEVKRLLSNNRRELTKFDILAVYKSLMEPPTIA